MPRGVAARVPVATHAARPHASEGGVGSSPAPGTVTTTTPTTASAQPTACDTATTTVTGSRRPARPPQKSAVP